MSWKFVHQAGTLSVPLRMSLPPGKSYMLFVNNMLRWRHGCLLGEGYFFELEGLDSRDKQLHIYRLPIRTTVTRFLDLFELSGQTMYYHLSCSIS